MYINSNFNDYYDFVQKLGQDPKIVYNRKQKWFDTTKLPFELKDTVNKLQKLSNALTPTIRWSKTDGWVKVDSMNLFLIGGKIVIMDTVDGVCHNIESALVVMWERQDGRSKWYVEAYKPENYIFNEHDLDDLHKEVDAPIIAFCGDYQLSEFYLQLRKKGNYIELNPNLKKYGLTLDAYEVYTLIFNYFQAEEPEIIEVDDKYKAIAHGMDKTSFRRERGGPTRKRKKQK